MGPSCCMACDHRARVRSAPAARAPATRKSKKSQISQSVSRSPWVASAGAPAAAYRRSHSLVVSVRGVPDLIWPCRDEVSPGAPLKVRPWAATAESLSELLPKSEAAYLGVQP